MSLAVQLAALATRVGQEIKALTAALEGKQPAGDYAAASHGHSSLDEVPPGSTAYTSTTTRPTGRPDVLVIFTGPDPGSAALDGDLWIEDAP